MTIDSNYAPEVFNITQTQVYIFTFENLGSYVIDVYELDAAGDRYSVLDDDVEITPGGSSGNDLIYSGGTVKFLRPHGAGITQVEIVRNTPVTQLVDYQPYTPFPAETTEYALDKLTMIDQERGYGGGGGVTPIPPDCGAYVPLAGTAEGSPLYGLLEHTNPNLPNRQWLTGVLAGFGVNDMAIAATGPFSQESSLFVTTGTVSYQFNPINGGNLILPQDPTEPLGAVTKQYADSLIGGTGYVPLAGTAVDAPITGVLEFENANLGLSWSFGIFENLGDELTLAPAVANENRDFFIAFGSDNFRFMGSTKEMRLPAIDYDLADGKAAVTKEWIEANFSGGGGAFIPLAGTEVGSPITGPLVFGGLAGSGIAADIQWDDTGNILKWSIGNSEAMSLYDDAGVILNVTGNIFASGGIQADGAVVSNDQVSAFAAAPTLPSHLTRKDYVDNKFWDIDTAGVGSGSLQLDGGITSLSQLAASNLTATNNFLIADGLGIIQSSSFNSGSFATASHGHSSLSSTTISNLTMTGNPNVGSIGTSSSQFIMCYSGSTMFRGPLVAAAAQVQDVVNGLLNALATAGVTINDPALTAQINDLTTP